MNYFRGAYVVRWDEERNAEVNRKYGISEREKDMGCGVTDWVK